MCESQRRRADLLPRQKRRERANTCRPDADLEEPIRTGERVYGKIELDRKNAIRDGYAIS